MAKPLSCPPLLPRAPLSFDAREALVQVSGSLKTGDPPTYTIIDRYTDCNIALGPVRGILSRAEMKRGDWNLGPLHVIPPIRICTSLCVIFAST